VRCYSGDTYAQRPLSIRRHGRQVPVDEIVAAWREPPGPCFRVRTRAGEFVLAYDESRDEWRLVL